STSAGAAAARSCGRGQRAIHCSHTGATRETGVCWDMTSLTRTPHGVVPGRRHGRSRACTAYQEITVVWRSANTLTVCPLPGEAPPPLPFGCLPSWCEQYVAPPPPHPAHTRRLPPAPPRRAARPAAPPRRRHLGGDTAARSR